VTRPALAIAPEAAETETAVPRYWRPSRLAQRLDMGRQGIYSLIKRGDLPAVRIGGSLRVREDDVLAYLEKCGGRRP
jgi:excisionase family DNA binding protein